MKWSELFGSKRKYEGTAYCQPCAWKWSMKSKDKADIPHSIHCSLCNDDLNVTRKEVKS